MFITESELRELWRDGKGALPVFPPGTRFSPAALDFLKTHKLEIRFESAALSGLRPPTSDVQRPAWDKPGAFPVVLTGPAPVCLECGQPLNKKPEHMTQVDAGHFAPKTHPRVKLRGRLDSLHAAMMLAAAEARRYQLPQLAEHLDTLAAYCREVQSAEYNARPIQPLAVAGRTEEEIHDISHWPDKHLGIAHIVPGAEDHAILHWLNFVRTMTREIEIESLELYGPKGHTHENQNADGSIPKALNRLSSAVYYLELLFKRGDLGWKVGG